MSAARAAGAESHGHVRVTQVRSSISTKPKHRGTLRALGLRGIGRSRVLPDVPDVRGMLARVPHLVEVVPATAEEASVQRELQVASRHAHRVSEGLAPAGPASDQQRSGRPGSEKRDRS